MMLFNISGHRRICHSSAHSVDLTLRPILDQPHVLCMKDYSRFDVQSLSYATSLVPLLNSVLQTPMMTYLGPQLGALTLDKLYDGDLA